MNERIAELEKMLDIALAQRTQAYKLRLNRNFIRSLNTMIWDFKIELEDLKAGA